MEKTSPIYLHELQPMRQEAILEECLCDDVLKDAIEKGTYIIVGYALMHPVTDEQANQGEF